MATGTIILYPGLVTLPDGTTNNAFMRAQQWKSTGTEPANAPDVYGEELLAGDTNDDHVIFKLPVIQDYASGGTIYVLWKRASGTGAADVVIKAAVAAVTPGAGEVPNTKIFNTVSTVTTAAGTVAQALVQSTLSPTMDGAVARDSLWIMVGRDRDNAADTLTGVDIQITDVWFEYITS